MLTYPRWVWVAVFLVAFPTLRAQVTFCLPIVNNVNPGQVVNMPVQVARFDSIVGVQFVIQWDPAVLNFLSVLNFNLPGLVIQNFGTNETQQGILRFAWNTPLVRTGVSLPDSSTIFLVKFSAKGQQGQGTPVIFTEIPPTQFEVIKADTLLPPLGIEDCVLKHGYVAIGFSVSTDEPETSFPDWPVHIQPNPSRGRVVVGFDIGSAEEVLFILMDAGGRVIGRQQHYLSAGRHGIEIADSFLPSRGYYFLLIRTRARKSLLPLVRL